MKNTLLVNDEIWTYSCDQLLYPNHIESHPQYICNFESPDEDLFSIPARQLEDWSSTFRPEILHDHIISNINRCFHTCIPTAENHYAFMSIRWDFDYAVLTQFNQVCSMYNLSFDREEFYNFGQQRGLYFCYRSI